MKVAMADDGTIRDLRSGRVIGKTDNLYRAFADAVAAGGPPCLLVGPQHELDQLREHVPEWVEFVADPDTVRGVVYAIESTLADWVAARG